MFLTNLVCDKLKSMSDDKSTRRRHRVGRFQPGCGHRFIWPPTTTVGSTRCTSKCDHHRLPDTHRTRRRPLGAGPRRRSSRPGARRLQDFLTEPTGTNCCRQCDAGLAATPTAPSSSLSGSASTGPRRFSSRTITSTRCARIASAGPTYPIWCGSRVRRHHAFRIRRC